MAIDTGTDEFSQRDARQEAFDSQSTDQQDDLGPHQGQLPLEIGTTEGNLARGGAPITGAAPGLSGEALGNSGHVDMAAELCLGYANGCHPAKQFTPGATGKRTPNLGFDDAGCLPQKHDGPGVCLHHHGSGPGNGPRLHTETAGEDLLVEVLEVAHCAGILTIPPAGIMRKFEPTTLAEEGGQTWPE